MDVVILNFNSFDDTTRLVNNLIKMDKLVENIVIVDNKSTAKNEQEKLLKYRLAMTGKNINNKNLEVILNRSNTGYAAGNNVGLRFLASKDNKDNLVAIMNPDIDIQENQLSGLLNCHKNCEKKWGDNSIGVISPWVINKNFKGLQAWKMPNLISDVLSASIILKKIKGDILTYKGLKQNDGVKNVDVLPGSFLLLNKTALEKIDYLNESTFLYCEERILGYNLKKFGYISLLDTDHYYIHEHSKTINKYVNNLQKIDYLYDSKKIYYSSAKGSKLQGSIINSLRTFSKVENTIIHLLKVSKRKLINTIK